MQFLYFLESIRNEFFDTFFSIVTKLGGQTLMLIICVVTLWCVNKKRGFYLLATCFTGIIINQFLKIICRVPRPWVKDPNFTIVESARAEATGYSFPSGHTQNITVALGAPARFVKKIIIRIVCLFVIGLVAISRMYLGVHTPWDGLVSLIIGTILIFGFYPIFERSDEKPLPVYILLSTMSLLAVLLLVFTKLYNFPADVDPGNLLSATEAGYLTVGCSMGTLLSFYLDRKYIRSKTRHVWWLQLIKIIVGLLLILLIKEGLKPLFAIIFTDHLLSSAIRYFIMVVFGAAIWPAIITWIDNKISKKEK